MTMKRSQIRDIEIKHMLNHALTNDINIRDIYMEGIDHSYYYEGYMIFKAEEILLSYISFSQFHIYRFYQ